MKDIQELLNRQRALIDEIDAAIKQSNRALGLPDNTPSVSPGIPIAAVCAQQDAIKAKLKKIWVQLQVAINIDRPDLILREMENLKVEIETI